MQKIDWNGIVGHTEYWLMRAGLAVWNLAKGLGLLLILCAAGLLMASSFMFMMMPASRLFAMRGHFGMPDEPPGGRALYFFICLMSAWVADLTLKALDRWWERLWHPEPAVLQLTIRQLSWKTKLLVVAAKLYDLSFWIMIWASGMLTLALLMHDLAFRPAIKLVVAHIRDQAGQALYMIGGEIAHLPALLAFPAMLLILSFFVYPLVKILRAPGR